MTLTDRLRGVPTTGQPRLCNDPSGCRQTTAGPDQARCKAHRETWPEWRRRLTDKDMTGAVVR